MLAFYLAAIQEIKFTIRPFFRECVQRQKCMGGMKEIFGDTIEKIERKI